MTTQQKFHVIMAFGLIVLMFLIFSTGCSSVNCNRPEDSARLKGTVLECNWVVREGKKVKACLVLKKDGMSKTIVYRQCEVK